MLLAELLAVLVVLAILAALLLPALTGYLRRGREQKVLTHARAAFLAAQTLLLELYASGGTEPCPELTPILRRSTAGRHSPLSRTELLTLAQLPPDMDAEIWLAYDDSASLTAFCWAETVNGAVISAVWDGNIWSVQWD